MQLVLKHPVAAPQRPIAALQEGLGKRVRLRPWIGAHDEVAAGLSDRRGEHPQRLLRNRLGLLEPDNIDAK